jgi:hypothetical protein
MLKQGYLKKGYPAASVTFQANDRVQQLQNYKKGTTVFGVVIYTKWTTMC